MKKTNTSTDRATTLSIVGSGNVATHLALALHATGHTIRQVLSREFDHAALLARRVSATPIDKPSRLDDKADIYLLAVNDDALYDLALDLPSYADKIFLHTSGSTPATVLKRLSQNYGVVWSPQTFVRDLAMDYSRLPLCIEGSTPAVEATIEQLFASVSDNIHHLNFEQRRWAHLSAVFVNNFGNAINALAQELAFSHGIEFSMLRTLAESTVKKMDYGTLWPQQTGPAVRHDQKTIDAQRRLLADNPRLLQLYDLMTDLIQHHQLPTTN
ncbi:MAG: DUF2520 domain-containing protein [Bacteroidales bacterium]|nr:DUF2520 domain-containing protein [Bacteroidales bacterium]